MAKQDTVGSVLNQMLHAANIHTRTDLNAFLMRKARFSGASRFETMRREFGGEQFADALMRRLEVGSWFNPNENQRESKGLLPACAPPVSN